MLRAAGAVEGALTDRCCARAQGDELSGRVAQALITAARSLAEEDGVADDAVEEEAAGGSGEEEEAGGSGEEEAAGGSGEEEEDASDAEVDGDGGEDGAAATAGGVGAGTAPGGDGTGDAGKGGDPAAAPAAAAAAGEAADGVDVATRMHRASSSAIEVPIGVQASHAMCGRERARGGPRTRAHKGARRAAPAAASASAPASAPPRAAPKPFAKAQSSSALLRGSSLGDRSDGNAPDVRRASDARAGVGGGRARVPRPPSVRGVPPEFRFAGRAAAGGTGGDAYGAWREDDGGSAVAQPSSVAAGGGGGGAAMEAASVALGVGARRRVEAAAVDTFVFDGRGAPELQSRFDPRRTAPVRTPVDEKEYAAGRALRV